MLLCEREESFIPDVVLTCTHEDSHLGSLQKYIGHNASLFTEKPISLDLKD